MDSVLRKLRMTAALFALFACIGSMIVSPLAYAASSTAFSAEALSAKALLEDLLARRYSQALGTKIDRSSFSVSSELDLVAVAKKEPKPLESTSAEIEPISDLTLGMLDPEALLKKYSPPGEEHQTAQKFLEGFRIKTVAVHIGLNEALPPEVKAETEKWLNDRLNGEFGKVGKGTVGVIRLPMPKAVETAPPKTPWDLLNQFQSLAGQLALAIAILLGVLLWGILTPRKSGDVSESPAASTSAASGAGASAGGATTGDGSMGLNGGMSESVREERERERLAKENESAITEIENLKVRLLEVLPKVSDQIESVMRSWCQMGETGWLKVATFAEVVGKDMGKLPIPVDALTDVSKVFAKMSTVSAAEKRDVLQKAYWDLLTVLNLGASALDQPFGYLGGFNIGMVSQVLMEQNPKMKTVVSLFMPQDLRMKYMSSMSLEAKRELLLAAANLSEIPTRELRQLDVGLMEKFKPTGKEDVVPLEMTLNKLVSALTPNEEIVLLAGMQGTAAMEFRRTTPSLAFLSEWPDAPLSILLAQASTDEIVAFCRVRPDLRERMLKTAPEMTSQMANDELSRPDKQSAKDKGVWIESFAKRLRTLVMTKQIVMEEIFPETGATEGAAAAEGTNNGAKNAA